MGYSAENYRRVIREYEEKRASANAAAEARRREVERKLPELKQIDAALAQTATNIMIAITQGREGIEERMLQLQRENEELLAIRGDILQKAGYPADYTRIKYECAVCEDTGYHNFKLCDCMKKALTLAGYASSGLAGLMSTQSFSTFSLDYYSGEERTRMKEIFDVCKRYATEFDNIRQRNLLFCGSTGAGKTHLSTAIAKVVIDSGHDVVYETAQNIFRDFEIEHFGHGGEMEAPVNTAKYFDCDLLIIDDLGVEMTTQFTVSTFHNLINTRINRGLSTVISTNLTHKRIGERYDDRILSRLMGEYQQLMFAPTDVRMERLRG